MPNSEHSLGDGFTALEHPEGSRFLSRKLTVDVANRATHQPGRMEICACDGTLAAVHRCIMDCHGSNQTGEVLSGAFGDFSKVGNEQSRLIRGQALSLVSAQTRCARAGLARIAKMVENAQKKDGED